MPEARGSGGQNTFDKMYGSFDIFRYDANIITSLCEYLAPRGMQSTRTTAVHSTFHIAPVDARTENMEAPSPLIYSRLTRCFLRAFGRYFQHPNKAHHLW